jgi:hypothetical protein
MKKCLLALLISLLSTSVLADNQFGLSIGSPAVVNFVYKGEVADIPIQVAGSYWGDSYSGIEVGYRFVEREGAFSSAQILAGYSRLEDSNDFVDEWTYVGASATFSWGGFYIEPGISVGSGDYSSPQLLFQAGYLWKF